MDKIVNDMHEKVSINPSELYPVANKDLVIGESNSEIQGNPEEKSNYYASNESRGKSILVHHISPEANYSLVLIVVQGDYSSSTLVTLAVVISRSEISRWRSERGSLSLFLFCHRE